MYVKMLLWAMNLITNIKEGRFMFHIFHNKGRGLNLCRRWEFTSFVALEKQKKKNIGLPKMGISLLKKSGESQHKNKIML